MEARKLIGDVPWIAEDGSVDLAKFPIDRVLQQALDTSPRAFRSGLHLLGAMYSHGREEAGVFLLGLLLACDDNWERRGLIVEALQGMNTQACANLLFGELKRVRSSNTTRRYLAAVIKVLVSMPAELTEEGFAALADDKSLSQKMRAKFKAAVAPDRRFDDDWS
jgi:hypothetical protein